MCMKATDESHETSLIKSHIIRSGSLNICSALSIVSGIKIVFFLSQRAYGILFAAGQLLLVFGPLFHAKAGKHTKKAMIIQKDIIIVLV